MTTTAAPPAPGTWADGSAASGASAGPGGPSGAGNGSGDGRGGGAPQAPELLRFARAVDAALDRVAGTPGWSLTPEEQAELLVLTDRLQVRLGELGLRVLVSADRNGVGTESGATSTAAWLAQATRQTRPACSAAVRLATALDEDFTATAAALAQGRVNVDQARVIVRAVNALTSEYDDLPPGTHAAAEQHLLDLAGRFDATTLHRLGKRLFEVVCPDAADRVEGEKLAKEEERARRLAYLSMRDTGEGTVEGRFRLPTRHGQLLKKAVETLTAPRRLGTDRCDPATGKKLPYSTLLGHGFMELLEHHLSPTTMPTRGGGPFTLVVTISLDALLSGIGVASLDTGGRISAGEARRLACRAAIIPMVLDGDSMPLDVGREQRLFTKYQRLALAHRHGGCAADGCDRPPAWTEAHHLDPWARGGPTDLDNGMPFCGCHHHMADHPETWDMRHLANGRVRFSRRQ